MPAQVSGLSRYPIKGLSSEPLNSMTLQAGRGVSGDRAFALALPTTVFDERNPQPLSKFEFMVLARHEALARLTTSYDGSTGLLSVTDGTETLSANVHCADGRAAIAAFFARFLPEDQKSSKPRLVTAANHCFTDVGVHSAELMHAIWCLTWPRSGTSKRVSASGSTAQVPGKYSHRGARSLGGERVAQPRANAGCRSVQGHAADPPLSSHRGQSR